METEDHCNPSAPGPSCNAQGLKPPMLTEEAVFGYPRDFLANRFAYLVISPRARGLSVGVNLNPVATCTLNCVYCEVERDKPPCEEDLDIERLIQELRNTLRLAHDGGLGAVPRYAALPPGLLQVRHVALSGDGEPTLASHFVEATQAVIHLRALGELPPFKIVLLTNSTTLDQPEVLRGLRLLTRHDEIWVKLDAGTQRYLNKINGTDIPIEKILGNILMLARERPVVVQSLFPSINGAEPPSDEIQRYAQRLNELKQQGAKISLVQIYSATRPMARIGCGHLALRTLCRIAETVRTVAGLPAEVF